MPGEWPLTLGAAVALLAAGFLLGRAWALARRPRGRDGGRGRGSHYLLGLNYLISNQPDLALEELSQAVRAETDAVEAYLALGNLFREKGQAERAIEIHTSVLHRPNLQEPSRLQALLYLALDFKKAGLVDRAERTLRDLLRRDPGNLSGWVYLRKVCEETGRWEEAARIQQRVHGLRGSRDDRLLASLWYQQGRSALTEGDVAVAARCFRRALRLDGGYAPAHLGLGDCLARGDDAAAAWGHWERALADGPVWASEALRRLAEACRDDEQLARLERGCRSVLERHPRCWRAHLILARLHQRRGETGTAREHLSRALATRPGSVTVQRALWELLEAEGGGGAEFLGLLAEAAAESPLAEAYVCIRCGFKSSDAFARCPHCQEWNTVAEEQT